jgi:hypothetical protein
VADGTKVREQSRLIAYLLSRINAMSAVIDNLTARVAALESQAAQNVQTEAALKAKLDAAIGQNGVLASQVTQLQADLAAAQAAGVDGAAVDALATRVGAVTQSLADSAAINAPSN